MGPMEQSDYKKAVFWFEMAAMAFVAVSWLYAIIIFEGIAVLDPLWIGWAVLFIISVAWLFISRRAMKKALAEKGA